MSVPPEEAAKDVFEVVPIIMREIRSVMRSKRPPVLTVPQYRALSFVDRNAGASLLDVANHLGLTPPSTSKLVDSLIGHGLMTREEQPVDRRRLKLAVTDRGHKDMIAARQGTLAYLTDRLRNMDEGDREVIVRAMKALHLIFTGNPKIGERWG